MPNERLLRLPALEEKIGFKHAWIYARMLEGTFPRPTKFGKNVAWRESVVDAWIAERTTDLEESVA